MLLGKKVSRVRGIVMSLKLLLVICCWSLLVIVYTRVFSWTRRPLTLTGDDPIDQSDSKVYTILVWTTWFRDDWLVELTRGSPECPSSSCRATKGRGLASSADAVLFHMADLNLDDLPASHSHDQKWILSNLESPQSTLHHQRKMNFFEDQIDYVAGYKRDGDIYVPYGRLAQPTEEELKQSNQSERFTRIDNSRVKEPHFFAQKKKSVAWFVSNCHTYSNREKYVDALSQYIDVDIYGSCGRHSCPKSKWSTCQTKVSQEYKFYLSFENSICPDYVTEKLFSWLTHDVVPIVLGGANYSQHLPPGSYINALDFESPKKLADYLKSMTEQEYLKYFDWKSNGYYIEVPHRRLLCAVCDKLRHTSNKNIRNGVLAHQSFSSWWYLNAQCKSWPSHRTKK